MKWGIVILLILGIVAAACAALLVSVMGAGSSATARNSQTSEVLVARKSLPAMSVVTVDDFVKQTVSKNDLPQGQAASPARVVGRVLSVPVVEGQVLTESCFIADGTGAQLAAALPTGMRAFTVSLAGRAIPDELLLYPGCVVDVLYSARLSGSAGKGEALSRTILQGIQVLAVQGESVVSNPEGQEAGTAKAANRGGVSQVTLLVDPWQAEALQVAVDNGSISLAIRNPLDKKLGEMEGTVLNQGRLATSGSALEPGSLTASQKAKQRDQERESFMSQLASPSDPNGQQRAAPFAAPASQAQSDQDYQAPKRPRWGVTVIRGTETKTEEFDASENEATAEK